VVSVLKREFTVNFDSEKLEKVVHEGTGADSHWSILGKSHLKNTQHPCSVPDPGTCFYFILF
jgi:hypothetical protein